MSSDQPRGGLKVLVAEDDPPSCVLLKRMLGKFGFDVVVARDGVEAVEKFSIEKPELVLMDVMMPKMDGYEAARSIKSIAPDEFVPLIFLTAIQDEDALAKCLEVGGDAFLTKPYTRTILGSKIDAMLRIRDLYASVRQQNIAITRLQQQFLAEQRLAEKVFSSVVRGGNRNDGIRSLLSPSAIFNGDLFVTATRATGELHFLVADFSGHGLSAAIAAMPASDIFYSMTSGGYGIADIAETINRKLKSILPADMFCAACIGAVDTIERKLAVWNGGMPPVLIVDSQNRIRARAPSRHMALGVLNAERFDRALQFFALAGDDRIFAYTDGLVDAPIATGGRFSQAGFEACFDAPVAPGRQFDWIIDSLREISGEGFNDDLTLVEIDTQATNVAARGREAAPSRAASNWETALLIEVPALRTYDPVPYLLGLLLEIQGLQPQKETLLTILSELFKHALDDRLLGLTGGSGARSVEPEHYNSERATRLAALASGFVRFSIRHRALTHGGDLTIQVESGGADGMDNAPPPDDRFNPSTMSRGLGMLRTLCASARFMGGANRVEVVYRWGNPR